MTSLARTRVGVARRPVKVRARALNPSLRAGILLLAVMLAVGLLAPPFLPDPNRQDLVSASLPPGTAGHLLGTDALGRDVLAWIASSIVTSLVVSASVVALSAAVGTLVGLVAGYARGPIDAVLMRLVDLQLAIPPLVLFVTAAVIISPTLWSLVLLLASVSWVPYARLVRAKVLSDRERSYVAAARLAGVRRWRILVQDLLPNVATLLLVMGSLQAGYVFLSEAALGFLGLGIQPPSTSLGFMIAEGQTTVAQTWWVVVFPGVAIVLLVLATNLIGDGLRDRFHIDEEAVR